jgi:cell division protein FtsN
MEDLKDDTTNAIPDMEVKIAKENQSPIMQNVINLDEDFEPVMSKSKRKWEKRKQKLHEKEQDHLLSYSTVLEKQSSNQSSSSKSRAHVISKLSSSTSGKTTLTETKNKPTKAAKKDVQDARTVITGHDEPSPQAVANVRDVLVYDVPSNWTTQYLLQCLRFWEKVISVHKKHQKKYSTVRVRIKMEETARHAFDRKS